MPDFDIKYGFKYMDCKDLVNPTPGYFGTYYCATCVTFDSCREQFCEKLHDSSQGFFYVCETVEEKDSIAGLVSVIENLLELDKKSVFSKTTNELVLWICPPQFWKICPIRKSFYTLIVRVGRHYDIEKNNLDAVLFDQIDPKGRRDSEYLRKTKPAVIRFLCGCTEFNGIANGANGWYKTFYGMSEDEIRKKLIKSKNETAVGVGTIWN